MIKDALYNRDEPRRPMDMDLNESTHLYRRNNVEVLDRSRDKTTKADYPNHSIVHIRAKENIPE